MGSATAVGATAVGADLSQPKGCRVFQDAPLSGVFGHIFPFHLQQVPGLALGPYTPGPLFSFLPWAVFMPQLTPGLRARVGAGLGSAAFKPQCPQCLPTCQLSGKAGVSSPPHVTWLSW